MIELKDTPCSRSCGCWNPYGLCSKQLTCPHHKVDLRAMQDRATAPKKRHTSPAEEPRP